MTTRAGIGLAVLAALCIAAANWGALRSVASPAAAAIYDSSTDLWRRLEGIAARPDGWSFPAELTALEGATVELTGVLFPLPQLSTDGRLGGALLAPPARFHCCGLACDPRPQLQVFVIPAGAVPAFAERRLARVSGRLHLQRRPGSAASDITAARIELLPDPQ